MVRRVRCAAAALFFATFANVSCTTTDPDAVAAADAAPGRRVYDVRDLVSGQPPAGKASLTLNQLGTCVREATAGAGWEWAGRSFTIDHDGYLAIEAEPALQAKVAMVLEDLRRFVADKAARDPAGTAGGVCVYDVRDLVCSRRPPAPAYIELPELARCLKKTTTDGHAWERPGRTLTQEDQGYLIVQADADLQSRVAAVLQDLRRCAAE